MMYLIPTDNIESLDKKMARLQRKAEKLNVQFKYEKLSPIMKDTDIKSVKVECIPVVVECKIHYENWIVVAVLEHQPYGNLVRLVEGEWRPNKELKLPEKYRTTQSYCDHCNTMRARNKTVVLYNKETKEFKQVGTTCLKEYTLGIDADMIAAFEEYTKEPTEFTGFTSHSKWYIDIKNFLAGVVASSSLYGYISKSRAREINEENNKTTVEATCDLTVRLMSKTSVEKEWEDIYESDDTKTFVEEALEWIKNMDAESYSYFDNLKVVCSAELVELKNIGYAASLIASYKNHLKAEKKLKEAEKQNEMYHYYRNVNDKISLQGNLACVANYDTQFGTMYVYKIIQSGCIFVWKTSKYLGVDDSGKEVMITGTIKEQSEFRGVRQNILTRCKVEFI